MIAYLQGTVLKKTEKKLILLTQDIGYAVQTSKSINESLTEGQDAKFFIYHNIREDSSDLYGFTSYEDLEFFELLISINGIGPKVGLEICNIPSNKVKSAILNEDTAMICSIPGIGQKTAQRIILELKGKISISDLQLLEPQQHQGLGKHELNEDVIDALTKLGYQRKQILATLSKAPAEINNEEELITYFLKSV